MCSPDRRTDERLSWQMTERPFCKTLTAAYAIACVSIFIRGRVGWREARGYSRVPRRAAAPVRPAPVDRFPTVGLDNLDFRVAPPGDVQDPFGTGKLLMHRTNSRSGRARGKELHISGRICASQSLAGVTSRSSDTLTMPNVPRPERRDPKQSDRRRTPRGGRRDADKDKDRRTAPRLRELLDGLEVEVRRNRHDLDIQFERIAQLQHELDLLKRRLP
jgi:hypothetical protein